MHKEQKVREKIARNSNIKKNKQLQPEKCLL